MTDLEMIEALIEPYPIHESPMGHEYCLWCDCAFSYGLAPVKNLHEWTCAWMRALVRLGRDIPKDHGWGERTWKTAYAANGRLNHTLYGDLPAVGDRIACLWRDGDHHVTAQGVVDHVTIDRTPIVLLEEIDTDIDWKPAMEKAGFLPTLVWTDLDIKDPRS
jgi:hypothetical protein